MTSKSEQGKMDRSHSLVEMSPRDFAAYSFLRARDITFLAVYELWKKRRAEGMKQVDLAKFLERDAGWVSRALRGPGNWTLRTFGELVAAMDGDIKIVVRPAEDVAAHTQLVEALEGLLTHPGIADMDPSDKDQEDHALERAAHVALAAAKPWKPSAIDFLDNLQDRPDIPANARVADAKRTAAKPQEKPE